MLLSRYRDFRCYISRLVNAVLGWRTWVLRVMKRIGERLEKMVKFERQFHWSDVIAVLALCVAILGYCESRAARVDSRRALLEAADENLSIRSARVNDDYPTTFRRAFCFRCMMPSPAIVEALWEVTVINNGQRDVPLIEYEVAPIQGVFEQYDRGLSDTTTGEPFRLPVTVPSGHAVRFRVRSLLVLPPDVATRLESDGPFTRELPSLSYLFNRLYSLEIDCFGNRVWAGPGGYNLQEYDSPDLKDQQLRFTIRSGRGRAVTHTLTWYGPLQDSLPSHGRLPWPQRPVSMPVEKP